MTDRPGRQGGPSRDPPGDLLVREARAEDLPAVQAIYAHHVLEGLASFEEESPSLAVLARRRETVIARGYPYLVAELDGEVGGFAYAGPYRPRPAYRFTVENSVYVAPGNERRGIGRALLAETVARCAALGFRRMVAVIGDSENWPSIQLHENCGFNSVGVIPSVGFKFGRWVDSVIMERPLGEGDASLPDGPPPGPALGV